MIAYGSLLSALDVRVATGRPLRVGVVGAGTFGSMVVHQLRRLPGIELVGVADLDPARAGAALVAAGWEHVPVLMDGRELVGLGPEVVVEATGSPIAAIGVAQAAIAAGVHVVMVTVEVDPIAGPVLARRARSAGVVYGHAYGDQPALICELVDWARACGFEVTCAGKGTRHRPGFEQITPDTVWEHYGLTRERADAGGFDARMFTSFVDGTKSAVEMAAVCNATGLEPQVEGLRYPPCPVDRLAETCVPTASGGTLSRSSTVEVVSSDHADGSPVPRDLRWGVFVTFAADERVGPWLETYGVQRSRDGRHGALYRPAHLVGLETSVSVLAAGLRGEPTGSPTSFTADVVAVAKRDLVAGEMLDGEGGYAVGGALVPAARSITGGLLPAALADGVELARAVASGTIIAIEDLVEPPSGDAAELRREVELLAGL